MWYVGKMGMVFASLLVKVNIVTSVSSSNQVIIALDEQSVHTQVKSPLSKSGIVGSCGRISGSVRNSWRIFDLLGIDGEGERGVRHCQH
ncbi:unnamed protein product [Allacma fusca]|uniref:Secreted protein n=1 Tax=Allacma fusca TaxID=39272 RepID=A0A8J2LMH1_9HEXA|nr:unnamed protein product [Allacma fusca]